MRNQLEELVTLAKQVRNAVKVNNVLESYIALSKLMTVRMSGKDYHAISFLNDNRKLEVNLYQTDSYTSESITVNVNLSDDELDEIILHSREDIIIFIAKLDSSHEQRRLDMIEQLKNQLAELENVSLS